MDEQLGILWDMDGTLIDSGNLHYEAWREALLNEGVSLTYETFVTGFGQNNRLCLPIYLGYQPDENQYQRVTDVKEQLYRELASSQGKLFPGVLDWLNYFQLQGIKQAIASSAPSLNVQKIVGVFNLGKYFEAMIAGEKLPSKPAPDVFLKAAQCIKVDPHNCIVFEDAQQGLDGAKAAGMFSIGVATTQARESLNADLLIDNYCSDPSEYLLKIRKLLLRKVL